MKKIIRILTGKWGIFILTVLVCSTGAFFFLESKPAKGELHKDAALQLSGMPVTVQNVSCSAYPARITALGEVKPLWQSTIKARVDGPIVYLNPLLQPGSRVKKGDVLVKIEKIAYQAQVSEDQNRLALAKVDLFKEEREAKEAQRNWERSGIKGSFASDLVLRKPQLNSARAGLNAAQKALALSQTRLSYTKILAPFDGVILERHANPGETLLTGDDVFTLYGIETAEVGIHVSAGQLALLGLNFSGEKKEKDNALKDPKQNLVARLVSTQQSAVWQARVVRNGQCLDSGSRLQTLFLQVAQPMVLTPPLLPGTFVRAEITGRNIPDILRLPETALTKQGIVWFVDESNRLKPVHVKPVFYGNGVVYIHLDEENSRQNPLRVAVSPNASFASGLLVQPKQKERG